LWLAGARADTADGPFDLPAIYSSTGTSSPKEEAIATDVRGELRAIDVQNSATGIAGGTITDGNPRPLCLYTDYGGEWHAATLPTELDNSTVIAMLLNTDVSGWAIADNLSGAGATFLHTSDGGRNWNATSVPSAEHLYVRSIARSGL
jgi:photosystem II stability/assembly factor-like uncharacterized protein